MRDQMSGTYSTMENMLKRYKSVGERPVYEECANRWQVGIFRPKEMSVSITVSATQLSWRRYIIPTSNCSRKPLLRDC